MSASKAARRRAARQRSGRVVGPIRSRAKDTLEHYRRFASTLTLLNSQNEVVPFELEDWELEVARDFFAGYKEVIAEVPSGSGKTTFYGTIALHHGTYVARDCRALILSASGKQARQMYEAIAGFVERSTDLSRWWVPQEYGLGRVRSLTDRGVIEIVSPSPKVAEGEIPTLVLPDEIHRYVDDGRAYGILVSKLQKRDARILGCTTAGDDEESFLGRKRTAALTGATMVVNGHLVPELRAKQQAGEKLNDQPIESDLGADTVRDGEYYTVARDRDGDISWHEWSLPAGVDPDDIDEVKRANPSARVTVESLRRTWKLMRTRAWDWLRQHCNRWALGEHSALDPDLWHARARDIDVAQLAGYPKWVGLDMGGVSDSTAIIPVWRIDPPAGTLDDDGEPLPPRFITARGAIVWPPGNGDWTLVDDVLAALDAAVDLPGDTQGVVFDRNKGGGYVAQQLQTKRPELKIIDHGQAAEMDDASELLNRLLVEGLLEHDGQPDIDRQVLAAAAKRSRRNRWYLAKPASQPHRKIDAAVALAMALRVAHAATRRKRKLTMHVLGGSTS